MAEQFLSHLLTEFERSFADVSEPNWLASLRSDAMVAVNNIGLPTIKTENWKYTRLDKLYSENFLASGQDIQEVDIDLVEPHLLADAISFVFVDGVFHPEVSYQHELPAGLSIQALGVAGAWQYPDLANKFSQLDETQNSFAALNTAFMNTGLYMQVGVGQYIEQTIQILHLNTPASVERMISPRHILRLESTAQAKVVEQYVSLDDGLTYFTNAVTEVSLAPNAHLNYSKLQAEAQSAFHIATTYVNSERDSYCQVFANQLGGKLVRSDLEINLNQTGAGCELLGFYLLHEQQHLDQHVTVNHIAAHTDSQETFRGIIDDKARAVFNGRIYVKEDAQKVDAQLVNNNLLLTSTAEVDTKPELEIYADDVKCAHGATVGALDQDALFYLRSRGLNQEQARDMLLFAFANTLFEQVKDDAVRAQAGTALNRLLPSGVTAEDLL